MIRALCLLFALLAGGAACAQGHLERVVLVARHGLRSPNAAPAALDAATGRHWPVWPTAQGELTPNGRAALDAMSAAIAARYAALGLPPGGACGGQVVVWADSADDRTRESGRIMARRLAPGCGLTALSLPAGQADRVFNGLKGQGPALDEGKVTRELTPDPAQAPPAVKAAWSRLQAVFAPEGCASGGICFQSPGVVTWKQGQPYLGGGPALAAMVSENLLLAWEEGLPLDCVPGWAGHGGAELVSSVMPAHDYIARISRRLPAIARPRGAVLAAALDALLHDRPYTLPDGHIVGPDARLVVFAGHDTTIEMLAGLYGIDWSFPDQPDPTAPDTVMAFERWRMEGGRIEFRVVMLHQGLGALRGALAPDLKQVQSAEKWAVFPPG